ncbi:MBL fold metallo-hydrolase [Maribacter litoralis]|uniref:MBL fold metallo-hydrolase n=1 Tax=Maribacter litoralis TaxID=2059726 RepID=UPI000C480AAA|nr:hypothetical protein [Allomuricauda sp.]|tara:strand:- start:16609 stop:17397 length:789 start_codon:yes stop_codon:yes gene_type:complete
MQIKYHLGRRAFLIIALAIVLVGCGTNLHSFTSKSSDSVKVHSIKQNFANVFLVNVNGKWLIIDSGHPNKGEKIVEQIKKFGLNVNQIKYLILTHGHPDHAGNAKFFQSKYGIKIIASEKENGLINNKGIDTTLCPRGPLGYFANKTAANKPYNTFETDIAVKNTFKLSSIGLKGTITGMSGHTDGSLLIEIGNNLFVGDLIRGSLLNSSKPVYHLFVCDLEENLNHINEVLLSQKANHWYPGHGGMLLKADIQKFINKKEG